MLTEELFALDTKMNIFITNLLKVMLCGIHVSMSHTMLGLKLKDNILIII